MRVVIIGGGGMLGQKLARALSQRGEIGGHAITQMALADIVDPAPVEASFPVITRQLDITNRAAVDALLAGGAGIIYHLAAIVSGQAEADFDLGMQINLIGSINVFEAARALGTCPKLVFTSSLAVYGGEVPAMIEDWTALNPQTSYGAQKAAAEMLLTDYSRKVFSTAAACACRRSRSVPASRTRRPQVSCRQYSARPCRGVRRSARSTPSSSTGTFRPGAASRTWSLLPRCRWRRWARTGALPCRAAPTVSPT